MKILCVLQLQWEGLITVTVKTSGCPSPPYSDWWVIVRVGAVKTLCVLQSQWEGLITVKTSGCPSPTYSDW